MAETNGPMTIHIIQLEAEIVELKNELEKEKKDKEIILVNIKEDEKTKEALLIEYELTQQNLLQQIRRLEQNFLETKCIDVEKQLVDAGLSELLHVGMTDRLAFLLVERARLNDEVVEMKKKISRTQHPTAMDSNFMGRLPTQDHNTTRNTAFQHHSDPDLLRGGDSTFSVQKINDLLKKVSYLEETNASLEHKINLGNGDHTGNTIPTNEATSDITPHSNCDMVIGEYKKRIEELEENIKRREIETKRTRFKLESMKGMSVDSEHENDDRTHENKFESEKVADGEKEEGKIEVVLKSLEKQLKNIASDDKRAQNPILAQQFETLHKEFELLKVELVKMISKYNTQGNRFREHKLSSQKKLFQTKEENKREKEELKERFEASERRLMLLKESIHRDSEYRERLEETVNKLLNEQKNFLNQISSLEETINEQRMKILELQRNKHST